MRSVITLKNLCLKYFEDFTHSGSAAADGAAAGGYNPLHPSALGGFRGDIHIGK